MKAISFILSGKTAHFKKPDVNSYAYFTYNNIHKPALCGLLGAVLGLKGYTQLFDEYARKKTEASKKKGKKKKELNSQAEKIKENFPEYYEKLCDLKVSIKPLSANGYFNKKVHTFNNSVGYASKEKGGNLIVREQWLESPQWQILILDNESIERELFDKLRDYLLNFKTEFIPYLGKNDHPAKIENVEIVKLQKNDVESFSGRINSLFIKECFSISSLPPRDQQGFIHFEFLPTELREVFHIYKVESFAYTNFIVNLVEKSYEIYSLNKMNYFFF